MSLHFFKEKAQMLYVPSVYSLLGLLLCDHRLCMMLRRVKWLQTHENWKWNIFRHRREQVVLYWCFHLWHITFRNCPKRHAYKTCANFWGFLQCRDSNSWHFDSQEHSIFIKYIYHLFTVINNGILSHEFLILLGTSTCKRSSQLVSTYGALVKASNKPYFT